MQILEKKKRGAVCRKYNTEDHNSREKKIATGRRE